MPPPCEIDAPLTRLDRVLASLAAPASMKASVDRWRADAAALQFHLSSDHPARPLIVAIIGGTGTGKSTLVNRLLGVEAMAANYRRTFTAGSVAVARQPSDVPAGWLGVEHVLVGADRLPARGEGGMLIVVPRSALREALPQAALLERVVLVDTPDLDGDQPVHHAEADRAFRWAQALLVLVTPEKYQMTELMPYYRLIARYGIPPLFVMNKCEERAVAEDYRGQLREAGFGGESASAGENFAGAAAPAGDRPAVYTIPRDDAAYEPAPGENLSALRQAIADLPHRPAAPEGLRHRAADLAGRFTDQILAPLREDRREADRLAEALRDMETPPPGVDVNPVTQDLERRLQRRSVLYLIGPQRVIDRVRQAPGMLIRLPRFAWDYLMRGQAPAGSLDPTDAAKPPEPPDFKAILTDQFALLQSRIDDLLRTSATAQKWITAGGGAYGAARIAPDNAGKIAEEELADLRGWLEKRWNATPRDTRIVQSLLKFLPGGSKMTKMAEAAPYLLALGLIAHHALFGTDLLVLGGYTIATWLTERLSNEVANRTRATNVRIADRFTRLAHEQIQQAIAWVQQQAVAAKALGQLERAAEELSEAAGG